MFSRLHSLLAAALDKDDAMALIGLVLVAIGLWFVFRPLAFIVPGAVLLWMFLPSRPPWIEAVSKGRRPSA